MIDKEFLDELYERKRVLVNEVNDLTNTHDFPDNDVLVANHKLRLELKTQEMYAMDYIITGYIQSVNEE